MSVHRAVLNFSIKSTRHSLMQISAMKKANDFFGTKQIHQCHELIFPDYYVTYILTEIEIKGWYVVLVLLEASAGCNAAQ